MTVYRKRCSTREFPLNTRKTEKKIVDFRKERADLSLVTINGEMTLSTFPAV